MPTELLSASAMAALFQVLMIDLVLAGDNAVAVGLAAGGLPHGALGVEGNARHGRLQLGAAGVRADLERLLGALTQRGVQLVDGLVLGQSADLDTEDGGALGHVRVVEQQPSDPA